MCVKNSNNLCKKNPVVLRETKESKDKILGPKIPIIRLF